jgi:hypothetical protein
MIILCVCESNAGFFNARDSLTRAIRTRMNIGYIMDFLALMAAILVLNAVYGRAVFFEGFCQAHFDEEQVYPQAVVRGRRQ